MIIAWSGPSGIGKGYIKETLTKAYPNVKEIAWFTTRALRPSELTKSNRCHISEEELAKMMAKNELALVQGMFGHRYAVRKKDLLPRDGIFLTEIHPYVIEESKEINPKIITIGLVTDDFELLRERLADRRKTESEDEIKKRVDSAKAETAAIFENFRFYDEIINVARNNEHLIANIALDIFAKYQEEGD